MTSSGATRATGATLSVLGGGVLGALVVPGGPVVGAIVGAAVALVIAVGVAFSPRMSASESEFCAQWGWARTEQPDAVAVAALAGRSFAGRGRSVIVGEWRGRPATRFMVSMDEGVNTKEVWVEGVFVDGVMPQVDLVARARRRHRYDSGAKAFGRAWRVHARDVEFAETLLHDDMKARLVDAPVPRRAVYMGGGFVGVRIDETRADLSRTPERLDFVSDLADLIPRAAWDVLMARSLAEQRDDSVVVGRQEYARAAVSSPLSMPVAVSAPSAPSASFKRVAITVAIVSALAVLAVWVTP